MSYTKWKRLLVVSLAALLIVISRDMKAQPVVPHTPGVTLAPSYAGGSFYLKSRSRQWVLDVENGSSAPGARVRLFRFNATKAQVFTFEDAGDGYYRIRTNTGGRYLTLEQSQITAMAGDTARDASPAYQLVQRRLAPSDPRVNSALIWPPHDAQLWRIRDVVGSPAKLISNKNAPLSALQVRPDTDTVTYQARDDGPAQQWLINQAQLREHPVSSQAEAGIPSECLYRFTVYWFIRKTFPQNFFKVLPEFRGVGDVNPPGAPGYRPQMPVETLEGRVTSAQVANVDAPISHYTHDFTFTVAPDPAYRFLLANKGGQMQKEIEVEWESGLAQGTHQSNPCATPNQAGNSCGFYSAGHQRQEVIWNWPAILDWVHVEGNWVWDRGHPPASTEIHPPRFVAVRRYLPERYQRSASTYFYATRTDLFASADGGALVNRRGYNDFAQRLRMQSKDYRVTFIHDLPRPENNPPLKVAFQDQRAHSFPATPEFPQGYRTEIFSDGTADIPEPHVTITIPWFSTRASDDAIFAGSMFIYWDDAPSHGVPAEFDIRHVNVKLESIDILKSNEGDDPDPDESRLFAVVGNQWRFLNEFTDVTNILSDGLGESSSEARIPWYALHNILGVRSHFAFGQDADMYVPPGKAVYFAVSGWEDDYVGGHFGQLLNPYSDCADARKFMSDKFDPEDASEEGKEDDHLGKAYSALAYGLLQDDLAPPGQPIVLKSTGMTLEDGTYSGDSIFRAKFRVIKP